MNNLMQRASCFHLSKVSNVPNNPEATASSTATPGQYISLRWLRDAASMVNKRTHSRVTAEGALLCIVVSRPSVGSICPAQHSARHCRRGSVLPTSFKDHSRILDYSATVTPQIWIEAGSDAIQGCWITALLLSLEDPTSQQRQLLLSLQDPRSHRNCFPNRHIVVSAHKMPLQDFEIPTPAFCRERTCLRLLLIYHRARAYSRQPLGRQNCSHLHDNRCRSAMRSATVALGATALANGLATSAAFLAPSNVVGQAARWERSPGKTTARPGAGAALMALKGLARKVIHVIQREKTCKLLDGLWLRRSSTRAWRSAVLLVLCVLCCHVGS